MIKKCENGSLIMMKILMYLLLVVTTFQEQLESMNLGYFHSTDRMTLLGLLSIARPILDTYSSLHA